MHGVAKLASSNLGLLAAKFLPERRKVGSATCSGDVIVELAGLFVPFIVGVEFGIKVADVLVQLLVCGVVEFIGLALRGLVVVA